MLSDFFLFDSEFFDRDWADRYVFVFYLVNRFKVGAPQMAAIEVGEVTAAVGVGECNSNSNEGSPRIGRFSVFYRDVRSDRDANRCRFFLGKNVNASVNGERPFLRIIE